MASSRPQRTSCLVLGLLGGVASGKSTVAGLFEALGAERIDADALAHVALAVPRLRDRIRDTFGSQVLGADGAVDRKRLGALVFADGSRLRALEEILHPFVGDGIRKRLATLARRRRPTAVVLDIPKLLEAGLDELCDALIFVAATRRVRAERAAARGWTAEDLKVREGF
ncbi:MAG: dephospho-CoA kinase, partial [Planctomycetes bacterium]|nr:dephospho-CoA kinase [Planctomycetota bacterium]